MQGDHKTQAILLVGILRPCLFLLMLQVLQMLLVREPKRSVSLDVPRALLSKETHLGTGTGPAAQQLQRSYSRIRLLGLGRVLPAAAALGAQRAKEQACLLYIHPNCDKAAISAAAAAAGGLRVKRETAQRLQWTVSLQVYGHCWEQQQRAQLQLLKEA